MFSLLRCVVCVIVTFCVDYAGKVKITAAEFSGSVCQIALPVVQVL